MQYQEYDTVPKYETAFFDGSAITPKPGVLLWANDAPPPAIGTEIVVKTNGCGPAVVTGYFSQGPWLGLKTKLHNPPEWHVKQNKGNPNGHSFGPEFEIA